MQAALRVAHVCNADLNPSLQTMKRILSLLLSNALAVAWLACTASLHADVPAAISDAVPESRNYQLVYELDIPGLNEFSGDGQIISDAYAVDNSATVEAGSRVAYLMELDDEWVWVSFDAISDDLTTIGIPHMGAVPEARQQKVTNMNVVSISRQITEGTFAEGNIEFWGGDYAPGNSLGVENASEEAFDFGDTMGGGGGHGCMQVHNFMESQVIFAYNNWGSNNPGTAGGLGIGSNADPAGQPDWTFGANSASYGKRKLYVLVGGPPAIPEEINQAVEESINFEVVYQLEIPGVNEFSGDAQTISDAYEVDNSVGTQRGQKVAYIMVLDEEWVWVSFDSVTDDFTKIGIPHIEAWPEALQQKVNNLNVVSNVDRLTSGFYVEGNLEFWGGDYAGGNALEIRNAGGGFDFGDTMSGGGGHGSMQVHNFEESEVVFAYNNWGTNNPGTAGGLGIGSNAAGEPDWTFAENSDTYENRTLYVLVGDAVGGDDPDGDGISNPLELKHGLDPMVADADSDKDGDGIIASVEIFELGTLANNPDTDGDGLNDGIETNTGTFVDATNTGTDPLEPDSDLDGLLDGVETKTGTFVDASNTGTDPLLKDTDGDRFSDGAEVAAGFNPIDAASTPATSLPPSIANQIPGFRGFELVYELELPGANEFAGDAETINAAYNVDNSASASAGPRVAYLLVLDDEWVWASFDTITEDLSLIGIPHVDAWPEPLQRKVSNLEVISNADPAKLTQGAWPEGNIEFAGTNYGPGNALEIENADDATFDFGDTLGGGGHGTMQVHNFTESEVVFAYNNWGSNNTGSAGGLGIGNNLDGANPDYTFQGNSGNYDSRTLYVLVGSGAGFSITDVARAADGAVDLTWESKPGFFYDVESSADLSEGSWEPFMLAIAAEPDPAIATSISVQGSDASMQYLRVVQVPAPPFLETSFEDGMGDWTVSGDGTLWEFGAPSTGPGAANSGTGVAATGLTADYADSTVTQLRTPVIDPAGVTGTFKVDFWYYVEANDGEGGQLSILEADGTPIETLEPLFIGGEEGNSTEWTEANLKLPKLDPVRPFIIQFNFISGDDGDPNNGTGWLIDDVRIGK